MSEHLALNGGRPVREGAYPWPVFDDNERRLLLQVLESGCWAFDGPKEEELAVVAAEYTGARHAIPVCSGTVALEISIRILGIGPGDEVIIPALTWPAPARAIVLSGAAPIFVDVNPDTWCLDPTAVESALTDRTRAILVAHTYGSLADMDAITTLAAANDLFIIEDCAHAIGAEWEGRPVGTLGSVGCFSFQQSKPVTSGEGGLIITNETHLADQFYSAKNSGRRRRPSSPTGFGGNYRITEFQAAILLAQFGRLDQQIGYRLPNIVHLKEALEDVGGVETLPAQPKVTRASGYGVSLRVDTNHFSGASTGMLVAALAAEGVPVFLPYDVIYKSPLWTSGIHDRSVGELITMTLTASCPVAERIAADQGMVVLHHAFLGSPSDATDIVRALLKVQVLAHTIPESAQDPRPI